MSKYSVLSRIILFISLPACLLGCTSPWYFAYDKSQFYFTFINDDCGYFTFDKCRWQECNKWWKDSQGVSRCVSWEWRQSADWKSCTAQICDPDVDYKQHFDTVRECETYQHQKKMLLIYIFGYGLGIGIPGLCLIVAFFWWVCPKISDSMDRHCRGGGRVRGCCHRIRDCFRSPQVQAQNTRCVKIGSRNQTQARLPQVQWTNQDQLPDLRSQECSICLAGRPVLLLNCGHAFHINCLRQYLKRQRSCPNCRSQDMESARLVCGDCARSTRPVDIGTEIEEGVDLSRMCQNCVGNN